MLLRLPPARWAGPLLLVLFLLVVVGCGGGGGSSSTQAEGETLTKKQFVRRMQAYCHRGYLRQEKAMHAFARAQNIPFTTTQADREKINNAVVLKYVEKRIAFLKSLPVPEGDEKEIQAIVKAMEKGLETSRTEPASLAKPFDPEPFTQNRHLTAEYGFWLCGQA